MESVTAARSAEQAEKQAKVLPLCQLIGSAGMTVNLGSIHSKTQQQSEIETNKKKQQTARCSWK